MSAAEYQKIATRESGEQEALFDRAEAHFAEYPELRLLYAVPNGGSRHKAEAANLKRQGVRAGVPDVCLPVARLGYHALYIELKTSKGVASLEQRNWIASLTIQGNLALVCYSQEEAWNVLMEYLR